MLLTKLKKTPKILKNNHYNNLSVDANDNNILNISKDGKKYVFFDNYQFNVPQKQLRSFQVIVVKLLMNLTGINIIFL